MLERLNQAMEHIERQLDQAIDVAELARIAATSEHHLRRMFSALAGMPLPEYIRRRRLTLAGAEVLAGHETLLDIAVRYGYSSGEAFARAFRAMHGIGPGDARRTGAALISQSRMAFRLTIEGSSRMRYRVVDKADFTVVGFKTRIPLVHAGPNQAIMDFSVGSTRGPWSAWRSCRTRSRTASSWSATTWTQAAPRAPNAHRIEWASGAVHAAPRRPGRRLVGNRVHGCASASGHAAQRMGRDHPTI